MLSEKFFKVALKLTCKLQLKRFYSDSRKNCTALFFEPKIQELLKKLATCDLETAFPIRKTGERLKPPEYKFMTDAELQKSVEEARVRSEKWLQMPPVVDAREDVVEIIEEDPALDGHDIDGSTFVFTDITYGVPEQERLIVVRESNGVLKHANWDQRHRMIETYTPRPGREHVAPPMFQGEYLESLLDRKEYKFILDRACAQYEPDDPEYIRVTSTTYNRVARERHFKNLHGTRHFGSLLFYLVFNKQVDTLLLENFQRDRLDDAISLVHLYHMIHPDAPTVNLTVDGVELVRAFIAQEVARKNVLELALKTCLERLKDRKTQSAVVGQIHGVKLA